jgi:uncharacterized protein (DUF2235 family)
MKRHIVCFDGTWQQLRQKELTNIGVIARSVAHTDRTKQGREIPQIVIYSQGVGANTEALGKAGFVTDFQRDLNKMVGGVFGGGLEDTLVDAYLRLCFNYEADDEIYIFGFSRGAFTARSMTGLINTSGIISRLHAEKAWDAFRLYRTKPKPNAKPEEKAIYEARLKDFRCAHGKGRRAADGTRINSDEAPKITYVGVFDTVGQRGMPDALGGLARVFNRQYGFHDLRICPNVMSARHALAIDERRLGFPPTQWEHLDEANTSAQQRPDADPDRTYYQQRWFIGTHGDVGGGEGSPLSAAPLKWICEGARDAGLRFYDRHGEDESPLFKAITEAGLCFDARISRPKFMKSLSPMNYPLRSRNIWPKAFKPSYADIEGMVDSTVMMRAQIAKKPAYKPAALRPYRKLLKADAKAGLSAAETLFEPCPLEQFSPDGYARVAAAPAVVEAPATETASSLGLFRKAAAS